MIYFPPFSYRRWEYFQRLLGKVVGHLDQASEQFWSYFLIAAAKPANIAALGATGTSERLRLYSRMTIGCQSGTGRKGDDAALPWLQPKRDFELQKNAQKPRAARPRPFGNPGREPRGEG